MLISVSKKKIDPFLRFNFKYFLYFCVQFFCFLLVVLVAEVSTGAWAYHNRDKLDAMIRSSVKNTVQNEFGVIESRTANFDLFQRHVSVFAQNLGLKKKIDSFIEFSLNVAEPMDRMIGLPVDLMMTKMKRPSALKCPAPMHSTKFPSPVVWWASQKRLATQNVSFASVLPLITA